jgi:hypothetical protein
VEQPFIDLVSIEPKLLADFDGWYFALFSFARNRG